jgi:hypothetical protein
MSRTLLLAELLVGFALAIGCGRTEMGTLVRGADGGGGAGGIAGAGSGGGVGGSAATGSGGAPASTGGTGGGAAGPCGQAVCLTLLFQTCVPDGTCVAQGGGSPDTSFSTACYANGVTVSTMGGWNGTNLFGRLAVAQSGVACYTIDSSSPSAGGGNSYVVTDASGGQVATGTADPSTGSVTVTCNGGMPTPVSEACLKPVGDSSTCVPGGCL